MGSVSDGRAKDEATVKVKVSKRESVAAVLPVQEHWLPLSNLDLLLPPLDVNVFFCYTRAMADGAGDGDNDMTVWSSGMTFGSVVGALKASLAQVLVTYYAFAGEVVVSSAAEPELLCNNSGVDFVEAFADVRLGDLDLYNPDESIDGKLVPSKKRGVLAVQATGFKCGGMVVACTFDHRIADAYSANMFLASWAEMCRSSSVSILPCFRRSLLYPRRSSRNLDHSMFEDLYVALSELPPPQPETLTPNEGEDDRLTSRIYYVAAEQLRQLQLLASSGDRKSSKLESFSSFLWKVLAKLSLRLSADPSISTSRMGIVVDGRSRLGRDMESYFGNVLSIPFGEETVSELAERPLSWVADAVHDFLQAEATKEHFLGLIDWVESRRPETCVARIYCKGAEDSGPAFVVSSGLRFQANDVDFGWGRPVFGSYHFPWGGNAGYVMPMPSPVGDGDWIVYMHLLRRQISFIESEAGDVFRPLTFQYLTQRA